MKESIMPTLDSALPDVALKHTDVLIVGAGPTGLTLAVALATRGLQSLVIDRQAAGANTSRAAVVHARTLEVLEPLGVTPTLTSRGLKAKRFTLRDGDQVLMPITFDALPTRYPYTLMLSQAVTESILLERLHALGGQVLRPRTLDALTQDDAGVTATLDDGSRVRARYVVGADGMHSTVRELAGIAFEGGSYGESFVLADVHMSGGVPHEEVLLYASTAGMAVVAPLPGGTYRVVAVVDDAPEQPGVEYVESLLRSRGPQREPVVVHDVVWGHALSSAPPGREGLSRRSRAAGRGCRARAQPRRRPGHECRHPRCRESGRGARRCAGGQGECARRIRRAAPADRSASGGLRRSVDPHRHRAARLACAAQPRGHAVVEAASRAPTIGVATFGVGVPLKVNWSHRDRCVPSHA
jgi:hypothetical protein